MFHRSRLWRFLLSETDAFSNRIANGNIDSTSIVTTGTNAQTSTNTFNGPPKFRSNADYIMETQKLQIQQRRKHRNRDTTDSINGSVYTRPSPASF